MQLLTRVLECQQALTVLHRLNEGGQVNQLPSDFKLEQLMGRLDLSKPILAGHSFGGCTAIATAQQDDRFK